MDAIVNGGPDQDEARSQSCRNLDWPASVSGCFTICISTEKGIVEISAPALLAITQCRALRMLAAITLVLML